MPTLREIGELEAIRRLTRARSASGVIVGSGDDAAVVRPDPGRDLVVTTDAFVEGRHYDPAIFTAREIGSRLAVANLSDLAAMAASPRWALLSVGARGDHDVDALVELQAGLEETLAVEGAGIVGGNLVAVDGAEWLSLALEGEVAPGRAWTRCGARAGDLIAVTGSPGRAAAGLRLSAPASAKASRRPGESKAIDPEWNPLLDAWIRPRARTRLALALARSEAVTAAIDVSDGFAGDLARLCEASGVGAEVEESRWPLDPLLERAAKTLGLAAAELRFGPSDDYELILAVDPARRAECEEIARKESVGFCIVGRFSQGPGGLTLIGADGARRPLPSAGFDHFARTAPR